MSSCRPTSIETRILHIGVVDLTCGAWVAADGFSATRPMTYEPNQKPPMHAHDFDAPRSDGDAGHTDRSGLTVAPSAG